MKKAAKNKEEHMGKRKCVFFDRDGIVNRDPGFGKYVERVEDFHIMPEFVAALRVVTEKGYAAVIVTNQRGVARGIMSLSEVESMHALLVEHLKGLGLSLSGIYLCPHNNNECTCRKPQPGMLLRAAAEHDLDLTRSWMVGDTESDVEAGQRAGCRTVLVPREPPKLTKPDYILSSLAELPDFLRRHLV